MGQETSMANHHGCLAVIQEWCEPRMYAMACL